MFRIELLPGDAREAGYLWRKGRIALPEGDKPFRALIDAWHEHDYERQWRGALASLVRGNRYACLVTVMPPVGAREMAELWPLLREGDDVRMRNLWIAPQNVDRDRPWTGASEKDFDGDEPSEWWFSVEDVARFLRQPEQE
jgi:hypothetical protein